MPSSSSCLTIYTALFPTNCHPERGEPESKHLHLLCSMRPLYCHCFWAIRDYRKPYFALVSSVRGGSGKYQFNQARIQIG